jgi:hypothetical protein
VAATRRAPPFREVSDGAILEIYTLEALRGALLVGPYSRFGWHHPGPLFFYLLAPWYWLSGYHTAGMQAGALVINFVAALLIVRTVAAIASAPTAVAVSFAIAVYVLRAGDLVVSAWNPHIVVLPLVAYIVLAAATFADPRRGYLLWLVGVGTFLAQTHVAMVPVVVILGVPAAWRGRHLPASAWAMAAGLKLLCWIPPLIEQAIHRPGNLVSLVLFFVAGGTGQQPGIAAASWGNAMTAAFRSGFSPPLGADLSPDTSAFVPAIAVALVAASVAVAAASRRRRTFDAALCGSSAVAAIVAFAATMRIQDRIVDHEVFWMSAIGTLMLASSAGSAVALMPLSAARQRSRFGTTAAAVAVVIVAIAGLNGMRHVLERQRTLDDHAVDVLTEQIGDYLKSGVRRPLFEIDPPVWPIAAGALLQIDKAEKPFAVGERWAPMFGARFSPTGREDGKALISGSAVSTTVTPSR